MTTPPKQYASAYNYSPEQAGVPDVLASATVIVPILYRLFHPKSVIDLGCGTGDWLSVWTRESGCLCEGYDGPWVPQKSLVIPPEHFHVTDFSHSLPVLPACDLAMCLEVAEHVAPDTASLFVAALCNAAPIVVWSAAVPGQGGYGHINEHYQDHWIKEFAKHGYRPCDCVRPKIWMNPNVSWWYQQNLIVYVNADTTCALHLPDEPFITSLIHPALYKQACDPRNYSIRKMIPLAPYYLWKVFDWVRSRLITSSR